LELRVPDAAQRKRKARSGAPLIRDRHTLRRSRVRNAARRFASCCVAPRTRIICRNKLAGRKQRLRRPLAAASGPAEPHGPRRCGGP